MLIVKKFGGTSVADKERIFNVAKRCIRDYQNGNDVVVVLSAMGKYTDELIAKAKEINPNPSKREMDMLFTIGEQMSVSLMAMAMDALGVRAISLNAFQVAMHTTSNYSNARLKKIDTERIRRELDDRKIVIVTGFQGINKYNDYHHHDAGCGQHAGHPRDPACRHRPERHVRSGCLRRFRCGRRLPAAHPDGLLPVWHLQ